MRGANLELQARNEREVILSGPAETGKTIAALQKVDTLARCYPNSRGAIIRKVRADMNATVLDIFRREFIAPAGDVRTFGGENVEFYEYPNGSRVWVGGMDRPGKVLSGALDFAYVNQAEELSLADWETLSTRTTGRAGVIVPGLLFGDQNPSYPQHWIVTRAASGKLTRLFSHHEDNPLLYDEAGKLTEQGAATMATLDALTGVRKERLRYGRDAQAEGVIYEDYAPDVHEIEPFEIPLEWRRIRVIDFGLVHPFVCQWWAIDGDGRMYRYRTIYMTGRTVASHARQILEIERAHCHKKRVGKNELAAPETELIEATACDHDAEDRATLAENGIPNVAANKAVLQGIGKVQDRLKKQADGRPRIFFFKGALVEVDASLVAAHKPYSDTQEFASYVWANRATKEQPAKEDDHGMDATRYAVMHVERGAQVLEVAPNPFYD